jgi:uncharacterized Zn finger protein
MAKYFGDAEFDVPCAKCGHTTKQKVRTIETDPEITCPHCGTVTKIEANWLAQMVHGWGA